MISSGDTQTDRIERLHDWFSLQLRFADIVAEKANVPFGVAVTFYTNMHPRFGFGRPAREGNQSAAWEGFVQRLAELRSGSDRVACTKAFAQGRFLDWSGDVQRRFGCFGFEGPSDGVIRMHFVPADRENGTGPLSRAKSTRRNEELAQMFAFIRREHARDAREVVGGSWLYNLDAYRNLFPPAYIARLEVHTSPSQFTGGSWWGQFIDHEENMYFERVGEFTARLKQLDMAALWKLFPLPAMKARVAIDAFYEHYGVGG